jgi:hypothetical protein
MFSHFNTLEVSILCLVIAIFAIKPIPLVPDRHLEPNLVIFTSDSFNAIEQ